MFVVKRKNLIIVCVLIITFLTFILCFGAINEKPIGSASSKIKIVLDAGHGGIDGGVSGVNTQVKESELNLIVVKKLEKYLVDAGMNVVLTRNSEAGLYGVANSSLKRKDMEKRKEIINNAKPNLVVSVHMNKYSLSTRRGAQVFYNQDNEKSVALAKSIQESFNSMEQCVKKSSALKGDYYILNCTKYPSVIAECGFLSNPDDERLLISDDYQNDLAYSIYKGIVGYLTQTSMLYNK
ncbi:MAG: N-acetylmuramoyl-L-alanine amidase [Clostridiales bacterium]|nr:N-acetylmuramoyl-L-alanine amidase [Clostridiales bacterium]